MSDSDNYHEDDRPADISPAAAFACVQNSRHLFDRDVGVLALAVLHAAANGWCTATLPGEAIPINTENGFEKLTARGAYLDLLHVATSGRVQSPAQADAALRAILATPRLWQRYGGTKYAVKVLIRKSDDRDLCTEAATCLEERGDI